LTQEKLDEQYWIKRHDKFEREKQLLLVLDDMLDQVKQFSLDNKIVDFVKISENLVNYNMSPKICIRLWENLKKNLKDLSKRENEFQTICRNEVNIDFWTETINMFKQRIKLYDQKLGEINLLKDEDQISPSIQTDLIDQFQRYENRVQNMMGTYFELFTDSSHFQDTMEVLQEQVRDQLCPRIEHPKVQGLESRIDCILSELLSEMQIEEEEREA